MKGEKPPGLAVIQVGEDSASTIYIKNKRIACSKVGIKSFNYDLPEQTSEKELIELCNRFRRSDGGYDVVVPGSGGKDSVMSAHILKYKYNMNPILVTWPPAIYTGIGRRNFDAWLNSGFANYTYNQNKKLHKFLTKNAFLNLGHPFQPFILGQKNLAPRLSVLLNIPLVVF